VSVNETVSFESDVKPLFREEDRDAMTWAFDLWSYEDVKLNAAEIGNRLRDGSMPCDGAWPAEQVELFERWVDAGMPS
jgi:hypothetical protein